MKIKVNGKDVAYPADRLSYDALCDLAGVDLEQSQSATYRFPNGASGVILRGKSVDVVEGGKYSVYHTGLA